MPAASPTLPAASPIVPAVSPTVPVASPTVPAASPTVPAASPTVPAASPTVPAASPIVPAVSPTVPAASPTVPAGSQYLKVDYTVFRPVLKRLEEMKTEIKILEKEKKKRYWGEKEATAKMLDVRQITISKRKKQIAVS